MMTVSIQPANVRARRRAGIASALLGSTLLVAPALPAQQPLSLGDAARLAARQNSQVEAARARVQQADARVSQRRASLFPDLSGTVQQASHTMNTATFGFSFRDASGHYLFDPNGEIIGPIPTVDMRYRVSQSLVDFGSYARIDAARSSVAAASADVDAQAEGAAANAALAYLRVIRADAQVAARMADSTLASDLLRIARDQLQAGVGIALDVTRAESQLSGLRAQIIASRSERERALLELRRAMGLSLDAPLTLADSLSTLPVSGSTPEERGTLAQALDTRADLRALHAQETAQQRQLSAIKAERWPTLGAMVDHGMIGKNWAHLLSTYTWGVQLSVPLFDGFRRDARMEEQVAVSRELTVREDALRVQSTLEVRGALIDLTSASEQVGAARERLRLAELEVSQAQERFRAGVSGNGDVIIAQMSLNQARTLRNDALASYQGARIALALATGSVQKIP